MPEWPLYNEPFTLTLRAFDVDEDQGEVDQLSANGEELVGGTLSGANNQWSINSFSVPGRMLKLYAPEAECVVTFEAYTEALLNARDAGELTSNGILRSLVAKVDAARSARERGDPEATTGALGALENELLGIHERHITDGARRRLLDLLDQLSESL